MKENDSDEKKITLLAVSIHQMHILNRKMIVTKFNLLYK